MTDGLVSGLPEKHIWIWLLANCEGCWMAFAVDNKTENWGSAICPERTCQVREKLQWEKYLWVLSSVLTSDVAEKK